MILSRLLKNTVRSSCHRSFILLETISSRVTPCQCQHTIANATWLTADQLRRITDSVGTPTFVYSEKRLQNNISTILEAAEAEGFSKSRLRLFLPFFANSNPHLLRTVVPTSAGLLLQVREEFEMLKSLAPDTVQAASSAESFAVSSTYLTNEDIDFWIKHVKYLYLSSLGELEYLARKYPTEPFRLRINLSIYDKPGFRIGQLSEVVSFIMKNKLAERFRGYHCYFASENSLASVKNAMEEVFLVWQNYFSKKPLSAHDINLGGGYGFDYHIREPYEAKHFPWRAYFVMLKEVMRRFGVDQQMSFLIEPGRDVLADTGLFAMRVTRDLIKRPGLSHLPTDGSFVYLPSAKVRQRRHNVVFADSVHLHEKHPSPTATALLRGRTTLRNDNVLPGAYPIPENIQAGDFLLVQDTGAYCATQHLEHGNLTPAPEVLVKADNSLTVISNRGSLLDKARNIPKEPNYI